MKLGINGRFLATPPTGVQRFAREVVTRVARECDVTLFLPRDVEPPPGVGARPVHGRLHGHRWEQLELPRLAAQRCDVLLHPANTAAVTRTPFVFVLHDVLPLTNPAWFGRRFALWYRTMVPRAARAAARVVTVSEWSRREICRATGASPMRVVIAPEGLAPFDEPASTEAVLAVRERYHLPSRFLLAVGGDARKNVGFLETMLERWNAIHGDALPLVIVGESIERVHGRVTSATTGANSLVIRLGRVEDSELHALYSAADLLCFASRAEGFGRPPLEAIACGTPAVVSAYTTAAEVLSSTADAHILPLETETWIDTLRRLSNAPREGKADVNALRARWSWDAAAGVVLDACRRARVERRAGRARYAAGIGRVSVTPKLPAASTSPRAAVTTRVAIVHDWLTGMRGGERVLEELLELYPSADLFTLVLVPGTVSPSIETRVVATSFVDRLPFAHSAHRAYLPLFPAAAERLDVSGYELVISSSHCAAKGVRTRGVPHLCYCHTPMRYLWDRRDDYFGPGRASAPVRMAMARLAPRLRSWDVRSAARIHRIVANSAHVRARIRECWRRDAFVVHPPVDVDRFAPSADRDDTYVIAGALVPYKRVDLAIRAFNVLGRRLCVIGDGPEYRRLRRLAGMTIEFQGTIGDSELARALARARALVMPMVEDFGIIAVEAQAAGTPVISYGAGGALESVIGWSEDASERATGIFFDQQTPEALAAAVRLADRISFDTSTLRANARRFDRPRFRAAMRAHVSELLEQSGPGDGRVEVHARLVGSSKE